MSDRCHAGYLTSAERLYLDRLWQALGVDPKDERVDVIEGRLVRAVLASHLHTVKAMRPEGQ